MNKIEALEKYFGYSSFRSPQDEIVEELINDRSALVIMPTGGGKSICYQIPAILRDGLTIVISPLIALMQDQVQTLKQNGVEADFLNSTTSQSDKKVIFNKINSGTLKLLYVAPERLFDEKFYAWLKTINVSMFAIDEAHCVSQWGHDFRKEYFELSRIVHDFPNVPRIALTATANEITRKEIISCLGLENSKHFICGFDRPNITYYVNNKVDEKKQLLKFLEKNHKEDSGVVYCLSRKRTEEFANFLHDKGFKAYPYHAGLKKSLKDEAMDKFLNDDSVIIVATIAFGMGIDKPNVRFVCHLDLPSSMESYYQETGRAGRDGLPSNAWMLYGLGDVAQRQRMVEDSDAEDQYKRIESNNLNAMFSFCEVVSCRRNVVLNYFGENKNEPCGNCDNCIDPPKVYDASVDAQKALSAVYRTNQTFGVNHLIDILVGKKTDKVEQKKHDQLSVFGVGKDKEPLFWKSLFRQMIVMNSVSLEPKYNVLKLNERSSMVLKKELETHVSEDIFERNYDEIKSKKKTKKTYEDIDLTYEQNQIFAKMKKLRMTIAKSENVPPYVVFNDKSLKSMILINPQRVDDLLLADGVGEAKLNKYGQQFFDILSK